MANTDERLKAIADIENHFNGWWCPRCNRSLQPVEVTSEERHDGCGESVVWLDDDGVDSIFAAQKALEARDALQRIREATEMGQPFASAVSRPVLKAMVELIDKVLAD
jgi:Zn-finger nucleic acid-binding protein